MEKRRRERLIDRHGASVAAITPADVAELALMKEKLAVWQVSLTDVVGYYETHAVTAREPVDVPDLVKRYLRSREELDRSEGHLKRLKASLKAMGRYMPGVAADLVTSDEVRKWLLAGGWEPTTRNNYLGDVRAMFAWAKGEGYVQRNPCDKMPDWGTADGEIHSLTAEDAEMLLHRAQGNGELMTYVVLTLFCGIRPEEVQVLPGSKINLVEGTAVVMGVTAKTRKRRVVDLTANAVAWLETVTIPEGEICGADWEKRWRFFRRSLGWACGDDDRGKGSRTQRWKAMVAQVPITRGEWPKDALRHTYASMHYAQHQNEHMLKAQMGHWEKAETLMRHYRAVMTRKQAAQFWSLRPPEGPPWPQASLP